MSMLCVFNCCCKSGLFKGLIWVLILLSCFTYHVSLVKVVVLMFDTAITAPVSPVVLRACTAVLTGRVTLLADVVLLS